MSLSEQLLSQVHILLDKPISPLTTKQITTIISNDASPLEKMLPLFMSKNRGDLLLLTLQKQPSMLINKFVGSLHPHFLKNVNKYEQDKLFSIYALWCNTLRNSSEKNCSEILYRLSYEEVLKEGLKVTNLERKDKLFALLSFNVRIVWEELGEKQYMRKVITTYVEIFKKYPIAVPSYVQVLTTIFKIVKKSQQPSQKESSNQQNERKDFSLSMKALPDIPLNFLSSIIQQILNILQFTQQKPLHTLHKQCLKSLYEVLLYKKGEQALLMDSQLIFDLKHKVGEVYLYRKSTRDEARLMVGELKRIENSLKQINQQKMHVVWDKQQEQKQSPIFIENLVEKTNDYVQKYAIGSVVAQKDLQILSEMKNSKYLKKGNGIGGGKSVLDLQSQPNKIVKPVVSQYAALRQSRGKRRQSEPKSSKKPKDKLDLLLDSCLSKHFEQQSVSSQNRKNNVSSNTVNQTAQDFYGPSHAFETRNQNLSQCHTTDFQYSPEKWQTENISAEEMETVDQQQLQLQNEVDELIDLAYSFKFEC